MNTAEVSTAKAEDRDGVVGAIVLAFVRDPVVRWTFPDPLYERHGFEVVGTIQVEDAPPLVPMIRRPR